jgi:predicted nucleic acid-binding protein
VTAVTDTSVVLSLCILGQERILSSFFSKTIAPDEVRGEFERLASADSRFRGLQFPDFIEVQSAKILGDLPPGAVRLHVGETAALHLARTINPDFLLMDERAGRAVARQMGLKTLGVLGLLVEAKRRGLVPSLEPLIDRLRREADFWISPQLEKSILFAASAKN